MKLGNSLLKLAVIVAVCSFVCSFTYAATSIVFERAFWKYADHVSKGAIRIENELTRYKMKNFGQYITHMELLFGEQNTAGKPISKMSWEEYRTAHVRKVALELKMAKALHAVIASYLDVEL